MFYQGKWTLGSIETVGGAPGGDTGPRARGSVCEFSNMGSEPFDPQCKKKLSRSTDHIIILSASALASVAVFPVFVTGGEGGGRKRSIP